MKLSFEKETPTTSWRNIKNILQQHQGHVSEEFTINSLQITIEIVILVYYSSDASSKLRFLSISHPKAAPPSQITFGLQTQTNVSTGGGLSIRIYQITLQSSLVSNQTTTVLRQTNQWRINKGVLQRTM